MKGAVKKTIIFVACTCLILPQLALADGMIAPPPNYWMQETDQKAVIFYDEGVETLVLSITFEGDADEFGWIVPVPNKPEISKGSDELFTNLEEITGTTYDYDYPQALGLGTSDSAMEKSVTVIETKQIEYYDVTVLSATDEDVLAEWFNDNGYKFPDAASYILDSYIENGWYFVAMKIDSESLGWSDISKQLREGHATPVILQFAADNIVYPLKISSVTSQKNTLTNFNSNTNYNYNLNRNYNLNTNSNKNLNTNLNRNTITIQPLNSNTNTTNTNTTVTTATPTYVTGKYGSAVYVSTNGTMYYDATKGFNATEGTIEMWIKPSSAWDNTTTGYWEFFNVVGGGRDVLEFRRGQSATEQTLQFVTYDEGDFTYWVTNLGTAFNWDSGRWYHLAVTWSEDNSPMIYVNGAAKPTTSSVGSTWTMSDYTSGDMYIGQRGNNIGSFPIKSYIDEVSVSSKKKTASEIQTSYSSGQALAADSNTLFLAHLDENLTEEISKGLVSYKKGSGSVLGYAIDKLSQVEIKTISPDTDYYGSDYVGITLYVFADGKKTLPSFTTEYANWAKKKDIKELAVDDQGDPWIEPEESKYFLTKLTRSMTPSQMTEDLFLRDASNNTTQGQDFNVSGSSTFTPFLILVIVAVVVSIALALFILMMTRKNIPEKYY